VSAVLQAAAPQPRKALGRGLAALLGDDEEGAGVAAGATPGHAPNSLPIASLRPGAGQPRTHFDDAAISALADSIRADGVLQPLIVRPVDDGVYEIVAGERRWRAAQRAQLHDVPVVIREMADDRAAEIALVENLQREDLSAIEEAEGYRHLIDTHGHTQESLAQRVGKSRAHVANTLRLLALPTAIRAQVESGALSAGHARAALGASDPIAVAEAAVRKGLSVRDTEALARTAPKSEKARKTKDRPVSAMVAKDADTQALERELSERLGLSVSIDTRADGESGIVRIEYRSLEQLDRVIGDLTG